LFLRKVLIQIRLAVDFRCKVLILMKTSCKVLIQLNLQVRRNWFIPLGITSILVDER
jgi:hypothetical protein